MLYYAAAISYAKVTFIALLRSPSSFYGNRKIFMSRIINIDFEPNETVELVKYSVLYK